MELASTSVSILQSSQVPAFQFVPPNHRQKVQPHFSQKSTCGFPAAPHLCRTTRQIAFSKQNNDVEEDVVVSIVEKITKVVSTPVPGISPSLALGYPLALAMGLLIFPTLYSIVLIGFFCVYSYLGRTLVFDEDMDYDDDEDEDAWEDSEDDEWDLEEETRPRTDLFAFAAAIVSAGLVSPTGNIVAASDNSPPTILIVLLLGACGLGYALFANNSSGTASEWQAMESSKELEEDRMSKWDDKMK